jgi:hypothetical protein
MSNVSLTFSVTMSVDEISWCFKDLNVGSTKVG